MAENILFVVCYLVFPVRKCIEGRQTNNLSTHSRNVREGNLKKFNFKTFIRYNSIWDENNLSDKFYGSENTGLSDFADGI